MTRKERGERRREMAAIRKELRRVRAAFRLAFAAWQAAEKAACLLGAQSEELDNRLLELEGSS